jgi:hypothetical protein
LRVDQGLDLHTLDPEKMNFYRSLWGVDPTSWPEYFKTLRSIGIIGIEASLFDINYESDKASRFLQLIKTNNLDYIIGIYTSWQDYEGAFEDLEVAVHLERFQKELEKVMQLDPCPAHINCHAGNGQK